MKLFLLIPLFLAAGIGNLAASGMGENMHFSYDGVRRIEIDAEFLSVEMTGGSRNVIADGFDIPFNVRVTHTFDGNTLRVKVERNWLSFSWQRHGRLVFSVPDNVDILIESSSGSIAAKELKGKTTQITSSSGSSSLTDVSGEIKATASSGKISVVSCSGHLALSASSGSIDVESFAGGITAETSSGSVELREVDGPVYVHTSSGSVRLDETMGTVGTLTSSGSIRGEDVRLTGDSAFESTSGTIHVDLANQPSELRFDLIASSGTIHVFGNDGSKRFLGGNGRILIKGVSTSGDQTYE
jgi:DUF4097 and DUF4098 domain-containing protein YvlB